MKNVLYPASWSCQNSYHSRTLKQTNAEQTTNLRQKSYGNQRGNHKSWKMQDENLAGNKIENKRNGSANCCQQLIFDISNNKD